MKFLKIVKFILISLLICSNIVSSSEYILNKESSITIYVDKNSDELIKWAVNDLVNDINEILDEEFEINYTDQFNDNAKGIYICKFDDKLINGLSYDYRDRLENKWEKFIIQKNGDNLFIIGSDIRGTVYGIFDFAEHIGISPWKWWADVNPIKKDSLKLKLSNGGIEKEPSVQYRGIFLNDEDWGLQPWAANNFEPDVGDIGPKTYEKIFQLLLRLKANTIWPAMHPSTKAFFQISGNQEIAKKYHIYVGTSHAEPMLRNNVDEWDKEVNGEYNYFTNSINVKNYWQERITEVKDGNNIITLGMRGIHDSGMKGNASEEERVKILEKIMEDQREILSVTINKPIEEIPQVLIPYKEVLNLYNANLKVPEDVTLMWTDDNYGYIRRLSNETEQMRLGGSGIYYHVSYWGRPHDYLWISTTQPGLIWYEMKRAYENGSKKIWIVNVGDIKPAEYNMEFFLDLAWDINSINENTIKTHLNNWSVREFGVENADEIADMMSEYYRLAFLRKPEYMGWSRTEPTTQTIYTEFTQNNDNEIDRRINAYKSLFDKSEKIKANIPTERQDAYFQLIEYQVKGAALMNYKFLYAHKSLLSKDLKEKELFNSNSKQAFEEIKELTFYYNNKMSNGKWKSMMTMDPRDLPVYSLPSYHLENNTSTEIKFEHNKQNNNPIFIQAANFSKSENANNYKWKTVEGLGYSDRSITLFPFDNNKFEDKHPYLEYEFNVKEVGDYNLEIRCLPTHSNNYDYKVWIEIDGITKIPTSINTKGRSEQWKKNVLRNFVSVTYPLKFSVTGNHTLKIYVNHTGIVLDQIAVTPESYPDYYEIIN